MNLKSVNTVDMISQRNADPRRTPGRNRTRNRPNRSPPLLLCDCILAQSPKHEAISSNRLYLVRAFRGRGRRDCPGRGRAHPLMMAAMPKPSRDAPASVVAVGIEEPSSGASAEKEEEADNEQGRDNNEVLGDVIEDGNHASGR